MSINNNQLVLLWATACLLLNQLAHGFEFKSCVESDEQDRNQDQLAELKSFLVSTCADSQGDFCTIPRLTNISYPATVVPHRRHESATVSLAIKKGRKFDTIDFRSACEMADLPCPWASKTELEIWYSHLLPESFPLGRTEMRLTIFDNKFNDLICVEFPVDIV